MERAGLLYKVLMNPGSLDTLVEVYDTVVSVGDFNKATVDRRLLGCFWCSVNYLTKTLVYSGNEGHRAESIWPMPIVRFTFKLDFEFPFKSVEIHHDGYIYKPREPGIKVSRGGLMIYNCHRQIPEADELPDNSWGSGS